MGATARPRWVCITWVALAGCYGGSDSDGDGGSSGGADETTGDSGNDPSASSTPTTMPNTTDPIDCVPGGEDCECLDGECIGDFSCVEGICLPGPLFEPEADDDEEPQVLAGLVVPVTINVTADEFTWTQVDGPATEIIGEGPSVLVPVPPDAAVGDVITLRINATRNTVQASFDWHITVREAVFENFLAGITDTEELGTSEGLDFDGNGNMWVVSTEGFVSRFGQDALFQSRIDIPGQPVGARLGDYYINGPEEDPVAALFVANAMNSTIEALLLMNQTIEVVSDTIDGGGTLGLVNFVLPDGDGNVYATNRLDGQVFRYSVNEDVTRVLVDMTGQNPNALSFGPDAGMLYVGTNGQVVRVPILQDGVAGETAVYLDFAPAADGFEADGLAFDAGGNLYVGSPNSSSLLVARYVGEGATEVIREFSEVGAGFSYFVSLKFGDGGFGDSVLYWTQLADRTVGRLETGVPRL